MRLRSDNLTWREIDGETVLLDLAGSKYLTVNSTGTTLLHLLVEERDRAELIEALTATYGISDERAETDVDDFVGALAAKGLLAV
ncbi:MAG: PqqD family protein [Acidothermaceae bacterium]